MTILSGNSRIKRNKGMNKKKSGVAAQGSLPRGVCCPGFAVQDLLPKGCCPKFAAKGLLPRICCPGFTAKVLLPRSCCSGFFLNV